MKPMNVRTVYPKYPAKSWADWRAWIKLNMKWTKRNNKYKNQVQ